MKINNNIRINSNMLVIKKYKKNQKDLQISCSNNKTYLNNNSNYNYNKQMKITIPKP